MPLFGWGSKKKGDGDDEQKKVDERSATGSTAPLTGAHSSSRSNRSTSGAAPVASKKARAAIEDHLSAERELKRSTLSLLLLGAGGSGKSTICKQMELIYNGVINETSLIEGVRLVRAHILSDMHQICQKVLALKGKESGGKTHEKGIELASCHIEDEAIIALCDKYASREGAHLAATAELTPAVAGELRTLWKDDGFRKTFEIVAKQSVMDNTPYFLKKVREVAEEKYSCTQDDYIRVRARTTGIVRSEFKVMYEQREWLFVVTDVGGQRTERKKWIHCFEDVTAILWVMSLAGYDQFLFEQAEVNCWTEAFNLFADTAKLKSFKKTDFITFLNKTDIFTRKIKTIPLSVYDGSVAPENAHSPEYAARLVTNEFKTRFYVDSQGNPVDEEMSPRIIHFHVTCATDTKQIQAAMALIQFEAVKSALKQYAIC